MKRMLAMMLCLAMVLTTLVMPASAEDAAYRTLYSSEISSLNYLTTATTSEFAVAANVIDTLVEYDKYGQIKPSLAESWVYDAESLTYTFTLRQDATWVKADGSFYANVTAHDFVSAAKYILNAENASSTANIFYSVIAGAKAYYQGTSTPEDGKEPYPVMDFETVGVKAVNDYTLQYTLVEPVPYFLSMLTYVCFMPVNGDFLAEKGADFGVATSNENILYNGAYILSTFEPQQKRIYTKNESNWDADNVFITSIEQTYNKEAGTISPELYRRGEVDSATITSETSSAWLLDPETADLIHPVRQSGFYTYFWAFNFDPKFDAEYEPENWKVAVNNVNFRKALYHGLDRLNAKYVMDPDNPETLIFNTITPPEFVSLNGVDYTEMGALAEITALGLDTFNPDLALQYKEKAMAELKDTVTFPVKVVVPYLASSSSWADECVVVEQQMENLLGTDFIDIIVTASSESGPKTRRAGVYSMMKVNWGPDYADPNTYTDPFYEGTYNWPQYATEYLDENGTPEYYKLVDAARAITDDMQARFEAYATAEAFLINNAMLLPYGYDNGGYTASLLNPFESQYAPFGISNERYKGQHLLEKPMNTDEYFDAYDAWLDARAALAEDAE
ncbi:MAG: peptide ABC transporter substrate-binding protein [Clostridia bacterium]|nr:peptide ABC transporter substrate-binding protein [Clostridia bacterium]